MDKTSLGDRMKGYEGNTKRFLLGRTPVIIRVDGKAFHTFTRRIHEDNDPSSTYGPSEKFHEAMVMAMIAGCEQFQNCVLAYTQSDEISFLLKDWTNIESQQWFNGNVQKIASVAASTVTAYFNYEFAQQFPNVAWPPALFDTRVFNVPKEEVTNYFIWRQNDATRNSVQSIGRKHFSHNQMANKSNEEIQEMLWREHDCNWNDYMTWKKRGSCAIKVITGIGIPNTEVAMRSHWERDESIPIFTQNREYIEKLL